MNEIRYSRETGYNMGQDYCDAVLFAVRGPKKGRRTLGKPTSEAQEYINEKNARMHFARMANANFTDGRDCLVHLTFDSRHRPETRRDCKRMVDNFLRRLKRAWDKAGMERELRYLYVIEGNDGKRLHVHMLMTGGMAAGEIKALWGMADIVNVDRLQAGKKGYEALSKYLTKQGKLSDGEHRWYGSRNLVKPDYEERNAKIPMDEVEELGNYIEHELEAGEDVIPTAERYAPIEERYPGYYCAEATAKYLETFREWVIHIQLYRKDTPAGLLEAKRRRTEEREIAKRKALMAAMREEV